MTCGLMISFAAFRMIFTIDYSVEIMSHTQFTPVQVQPHFAIDLDNPFWSSVELMGANSGLPLCSVSRDSVP